MIVALDSSTPECGLFLYDGSAWHDYSWQAGRTLADTLHEKLQDSLKIHHKTLHDISGIIAYKGPGSFTGLRIGLTVMNTIASSLPCSIVGQTDTDWRSTGLGRLDAGETDRVVLPLYGSEPIITQPKK
jgi:tRNA threonylcarbamoyladenosine biosynthesis protein TsaB